MDRDPEHANTHRGDGGVEPGREKTVAIVQDEAIAVRFREELPELLAGPHGGGVRRDVDMEQASAPDLHRNEDVQDPERRSDDHAEIAGHQGLGVIPHARGPPLPGRAGACSSATMLAAHVAAHGARRHADPPLSAAVPPQCAPRPR